MLQIYTFYLKQRSNMQKIYIPKAKKQSVQHVKHIHTLHTQSDTTIEYTKLFSCLFLCNSQYTGR